MKALIVEDEDPIREFLASFLEDEFEAQVFQAASGNAAIEILKNDTVDIILADYNMPNGNGGVLYVYLRENLPNIPYILVSSEDLAGHEEFNSFYEDHPGNNHILKPFSEEELVQKIEKALKSESTQHDHEYVPVHIHTIGSLESCPADIFIKISTEKFVKVINANSGHHKEISLKYEQKRTSFMYAKREDFKKVVDLFNQTQIKRLTGVSKGSSATLQEKIDAIYGPVSSIREQLLRSGVTKKTKELAEATVEVCLSIFDTKPRIQELLESMRDNGGYNYQHSVLTSYFCIHIAHEMGWETKEANFRFCMASFLHDLVLENDELAKIESLEEDAFKNLSPEDKEIFESHPMKCAEFVDDLDFEPIDLKEVIEQHHEKPDGTGFPKGYKAKQINKYACAFIVAHDFASLLIRKGELNKEFSEEIARLTKKYQVSKFKEPLAAIIDRLVFDYLK